MTVFPLDENLYWGCPDFVKSKTNWLFLPGEAMVYVRLVLQENRTMSTIAKLDLYKILFIMLFGINWLLVYFIEQRYSFIGLHRHEVPERLIQFGLDRSIALVLFAKCV